jgi:hypothetical protein
LGFRVSVSGWGVPVQKVCEALDGHVGQREEPRETVRFKIWDLEFRAFMVSEFGVKFRVKGLGFRV